MVDAEDVMRKMALEKELRRKYGWRNFLQNYRAEGKLCTNVSVSALKQKNKMVVSNGALFMMPKNYLSFLYI